MFYEVSLMRCPNSASEWQRCGDAKPSKADLWSSYSDLMFEIYSNLTKDEEIYELNEDFQTRIEEDGWDIDFDDIRGRIHNQPKWVFIKISESFFEGKTVSFISYFGIDEYDEQREEMEE